MGAGGAGAIGEEWRSRAVTHLNIPDSFPVGEDSFVPQPFQNGAIIETRSFGRGYRGAWFLSEVVGFKSVRSLQSQQVKIRHLSFPDDKPSKLSLYQIDPNDKGTRYLMVRPVPPRHIPFGEDAANLGQTDQPVFKQERQYATGDKVDAFVSGCWWSGTIRAVAGKRARVEWRPDPFGEGGTGWIPFKNLRPSLRWAAKRWQMLVHLTGPLGKIVVPVGGSEAVKQTPGEVDGAEAETAGIAEKRGSSAGGPKKEAEEAPCKRDISVRGPEPGAKETPCKRPDSAGGSTPEAKQAPRKRPGPAGGSTPEGKETPRKRPGEPGTEAAPERPAKAGKKAANASPTEAKPPPKPGKSKEGAGTLKNKSTPPRIRPPPKVRTPLEIKPLPEKQSPSKVRTPHEGQESLKERPPPETLLLPKVRIPEKVFTPEEARTPSKVQDSPKPRHLHKVGERPTEDAGLQGRGESEERPRGVPGKKCFDCGTEKTTAWRRGPMGENTLCQTCGVRYWLKKLREKKLGRSDACGWEEADAVRRPGAEGAPSGGAAGLTAGTRSEKSCLHCGSGQHDAIHSRTGPPGGETRCKTCEVRKYASRLGVDCVPGGGHQIIETVRAAGRQRDGGGRYLARRGEPTKRLSKGFSKPSAEPTRRTPQKDFRRTGVTNDERGVRRGPGLGSGNFFDRKVDRSALEGKSTETLMHPKAGDRHGLERGLGRVLGGLENLRQGAPSEKKRTARELGLPELSESSKRIRIQSNSVKSASARIVGQALRNIRIRPDASGAFGKAASDAFGNAASERKGAKEEKERKVGGSEAAQAEGIRTQSDDPAVSECRSSEGEQSERDDENESEEAEREEVKVERERKKRAEARRKKRERIGRLKAQLACSIGEPKGQKVARLKAQLACSVGEPDRTGKRVTRQVARTDEGEGGVKSGVAKEGATSGKRVEATKGGLTRERRASDVGVVDKALSSAAKKLAVYQKLKRAVGGPDKVTRPKRRPKKGARREPPRRNPQGGRKSDEEESGGKSDASGAEVDSDEGEKGAGLPGVGTFKKQCVLKRAKQKGPGRPVFWGVNLDELIMEEEFELPENVRARAERELAQVRRRVSEVSGEAGSSGRDSAEGDEVLIHSVKVVGNKGRKESAGLSEKAGTESSTVGLETRIKSGMTESWMGLAFEKSLQMGQGGSSIQGGSQTSKTVPLESFVENEKDGVESRSVGQVKSGSTEIVSGIGAGESLPLVEASDLGGSQACETMPVETEDGMAHGEGGAGSSGKTPPEVVQPLPPDEAAFAEESDSVLDKAEALSAAEELLSRWEEASLDEARGLFLMVNLWSPDEESLGDPVAWYRDKIEALAFRGERFVEVGGAANVGAFRKWAVGPNDGEGTAEGDGHDRAPEGMKEAEDGPPSVAPREADVSVNDADVSTAARQLDVGELVGALLRGPSEAEHSINVPDSATANLAKQAGGGAGNFGVPDPVGEVSTEPVRREPLLSDAAPKSGASGFWTLTESLADVRAGGPELSEGLKSKAGLHRDDGRSPIGVLVSDVGCRASETDTSNRGPSLNGRPDSERELNLGEVLALVAGLHLKRAVISDDGIAADRGLKPNGCLRSHESDGVPNADVVQKLGEGPLSDGAVKEPHSDAGVNTNGALRAAEKREVDQGLDMDRLRTADGALDSDEEFTADGGLDSDEGVIADGGRDSDEGFTADGGLDSDVGPRAAEGRNVSKRPTEEEKMSTVRGLVSDEKVDGWEGHNSDGGLNSDALRTEVQKSAEELRSRLFSDNAQVSDKTAERSDSRQGLTRNGREHSDEATDSDEATKGSGGKGRERTERGAARDASDTHQVLPIAPPRAYSAALAVWSEHQTPDGRPYYFNRAARVCLWEKPLELMTPEELRNPLNVWKELVTPDGRIYYFNKLTMTSSWPMPEELRAARGRWVAASGGAGATVPPALRPFPDAQQAELDRLYPCSADDFRTVPPVQQATPDAFGRAPDTLRTLSDAQQTDLSGRRTLSETMRRLSDAVGGRSSAQCPLGNGTIGSEGPRGGGGGTPNESHWLADLVVTPHRHKGGAEQIYRPFFAGNHAANPREAAQNQASASGVAPLNPPRQGRNPPSQTILNPLELLSPPVQKVSAKVHSVQPLTSPIPPPTPSYPLAPSSIGAWLAKPSENPVLTHPQDGEKRHVVRRGGETSDTRTGPTTGAAIRLPYVYADAQAQAPGVDFRTAPGGAQWPPPSVAGTVTELPAGGASWSGTEGKETEAGCRFEQVPGGTISVRQNLPAGVHAEMEAAGRVRGFGGTRLGESGYWNEIHTDLKTDGGAEGPQPATPALARSSSGSHGQPEIWHTVLPSGVLISRIGTPPDVHQGSMLPPAAGRSPSLPNAPVSNRGGAAADFATPRVTPTPIWVRRRVSENLTVFRRPPTSIQGGTPTPPSAISTGPSPAPHPAAGGSSNARACDAIIPELPPGLSQGVALAAGLGQMQPPRTPWGGHSAPANPLGSGAVNPIPAHPRAYGTAVIALPAPGQPTEGCSFESAIRKRGRPRGSKNNQTCRPVRVVSWEELQQIGEGGRDPLVLALAAPQKPAPLEARQSMAPLSSPESLFDPVSGEQSEGQAGPERTSEGLLGESQEFEQGREDGKGLGNDPEVLPGKSPVSEPGQEGGGEAAGEVGRPNGVESGPNRAEDGTYLAASLIELSADRRPDGPEGQEGEGGVAYKFGRPKSAESGPDRTEEDIHLPVTSPAGNSPNGLGWFYSLLGPSHQSPRLQIEDGRRIAPAASPEEPPETEMEKKAEPERSTARRCSACHVSKSERWRRGPEGPRSLCNRCGVYWVQKRDQWGELLEHFSTPPGGANGSPRVDEGTARLTVPAAVPEVRPQSAGLAHGDELAQAGNSAGPNAREDPISAEGLAGPTSPDGLVLAANRTVGRATFREVRSEEEAAAALKKSLWAAATWQRMAHSVARTTSLRSRLEEFGRGGEEGGVSGGGNGSVLAASAEEECNTPVGATRLGKSGESKEKAPAGGAECQRTGGGAAGREQRGDGNAGVPLAGGAECLGNGGGAATQTGEGGAAVQLAGAGRRYGPEEVWCGKYRGRWGPDGTFVWSDSKSRRVRFRCGGLAQPELGIPVKPTGTPGKLNGTPGKLNGTPVKPSGTPARPSGTPGKPNGTPKAKGKKPGPKPRAPGASGSDADSQARRERERKLWEKRMDGCLDRIHMILARAKPKLDAFSRRFPPDEDRRPMSLSPSRAFGGRQMSPGIESSALRGLMDWPDEEWELTPLPNWDSSHTGMESNGRHRLRERGEEEARRDSSGASERRLSRSGRGERRSKHLKVNLNRQVFVDRTLT